MLILQCFKNKVNASVSTTLKNSPTKYNPTHALRGADRLNHLVALPYMDYYAMTGYEGSIPIGIGGCTMTMANLFFLKQMAQAVFII